MATVSTIPSVRSQLVTLFATALPSTQVGRSNPLDTMAAQSIWLGETKGQQTLPLAGRPTRTVREELYDVDVWIGVSESGSDSAVAETEAFTLFAACENVIANDPTLGATSGLIKATVGGFEMKLATDDARQGWAVLFKFEVSVEARLN